MQTWLRNNHYFQNIEKCKGSSKATWKIINEVTSQVRQIEKSVGIEINNIIAIVPIVVANAKFDNNFLNVVDNLNIKW